MQALYLLALEPMAEAKADPNSCGFRCGRCTADAIQQGFDTLCRGRSPQWVWEADLKSCYDHIRHEWMLRHVPMDKAVLRQWLKAGYIENRKRFLTEAGTPLGGILSPTLANLTWDGLELLLAEHLHRRGLRFPRAESP
jgi:RNA-directed DNA polymerase